MNCMSGLKSISPIELFFLGIAISLLFVIELDFDELNVAGNFFIGIGGLMVIVASQGAYLKGIEDTKSREELLKKLLRNNK